MQWIFEVGLYYFACLVSLPPSFRYSFSLGKCPFFYTMWFWWVCYLQCSGPLSHGYGHVSRLWPIVVPHPSGLSDWTPVGMWLRQDQSESMSMLLGWWLEFSRTKLFLQSEKRRLPNCRKQSWRGENFRLSSLTCVYWNPLLHCLFSTHFFTCVILSCVLVNSVAKRVSVDVKKFCWSFVTEDEMAGWHHWLDGRESEWTLGAGDGQGGLACCDSWGCKESDTTERLNWICFIIGFTFVNVFVSDNQQTLLQVELHPSHGVNFSLYPEVFL